MGTVIGLLTAASFLLTRPAGAVPLGFKSLPALRPPAMFARAPVGDLPATNHLTLALGLPLHHRDQLNTLIAQLYNPHSTNYHRFLTPAEFGGRFGPTPAEYQSVVQFAISHGLAVIHRHPNRLLLDVGGAASDVGRAFQVHFHTYRHPTEARTFFAPDGDPLVPANLPIADVCGLTDYSRPKPLVTPGATGVNSPIPADGSGPNARYQGNDFRNAYAPGTPLNGAGQTVALVEFDGYYPADIASYESQCGYGAVPLQNIYLGSANSTPDYDQIPDGVLEVSLDIEMTISMAPGLSRVLVYEGDSTYDVYNAIATDNQARQISSSWIDTYGPSHAYVPSGGTLDSILSEMVAQGQEFFQASGDSDAYTGGQAINGVSGPIPVDSVYVTSVGGTSLNMQGQGAQYASETVWNWNNSYRVNTGSGGGISTNYPIPYWQAVIDMTTNQGSPVYRNIPDVALTADNIQVIHDNGISQFVGGTSCAAPLWAGFCALINQQSVATTPGGLGAGFLNPAIYGIGVSSNYNACFNDITNGNNVGDNTPGLYPAVPGYDLCTGWGTPNGTNLINALAPLALPFFVTQPVGATYFPGSNVSFSATVSGAAPIGLQWQFNGANLSDSATVSGSGSNLLTLTAITPANLGSYTLVLTNAYGTVTSSVASLTVDLPVTGTLVSSENPSGFEDTVSFAFGVVPPTATGTVDFYTNGVVFDREALAVGQAISAGVSTLPRGTNLILAVYSGDTNDLAFTNTFAQIVTNHPPSALPATFDRAAGSPLTIPVSQLASGWSDVDGDPVSLAGVSISTNGVALVNDGFGLLTYFNSNNVPDQFDCLITDGFGGTNYQVVNLSVIFPGILATPGPASAGLTLSLAGLDGQTYILQTTTNLLPPVVWLPLATNTLVNTNVWQYTDPGATSYPQRFYRLSSGN